MGLEMSRVRLLLFTGVMLAVLGGLFAVVGRHDYVSLQSFHVVADVSQTETDPSASTSSGPTLSRLEGWYKDGKVRWEFSYSGPNAPGVPTVEMTDGKTTYYYDATKNTYYEEPLISRSMVGFLGIGMAPAFGIDDVLRQSRRSRYFVSQSTQDWTYLDRKVVIVTQNSQPQAGGLTVDLQLTFVIDPRYMFILSYKGKSDYGSTSYAVTDVQYNAPVSDHEFVFTPPASAQRVEPPVSSPANLARMSAGDVDAPEGFFKPTQTPPGYRLEGRQTPNANGAQPQSFVLEYINEGSPTLDTLEISQTKGTRDIPNDLRSGDSVRVNAVEGYFTTIGEATRLSWLRGNVLITVQSIALSRDQLLSVARSMR